MLSLLCLLFATPAVTVLPQESERLSAFQLAEQAQKFVPPYDGSTRDFLTAEEEREVSAASSLLDAAIHLEGEQPYLYWWKGHCQTLLALNAKNRGRDAESEEHQEQALAALDQAIALQPDYYWAFYARAMALHKTDRFWAAIADYDMAEQLSDQAAATDGVDALQVRFHARQWRADTRMRILEFEQARDEFRVFYAANGNNRWDLGYSLAESHLRARDYVGARDVYLGLLEVPEFVPFSTTYEQLGYVCGLLERKEQARDWLTQSFEHELTPGMYPRLWLWILSEGDDQQRALGELREFLANPPSDLPAWDRELGLFMTGQGDVSAFLAVAQMEKERRMLEAEPQGDLMCEAWFYAGLRQEMDAGRVGDAPMLTQLQSALNAYRKALVFRPRQSKWEWEFARLHLRRLAERMGLRAKSDFVVADRTLSFGEGASVGGHLPLRNGSLERVVRHTPTQEASQFSVGELGDAPLVPGEVIQCVLRSEEGERFTLTLVVDADTGD